METNFRWQSLPTKRFELRETQDDRKEFRILHCEPLTIIDCQIYLSNLSDRCSGVYNTQ